MSTSMIPFYNTDITAGFWHEKQQLVRKTTIWSVYNRFKETGRFDAFKLNWKDGMPNKPHFYWDSDVAKWIEAVAYLTEKEREPQLEAIVDEIVTDIERGRMDDGYFNCFYQIFKPEERFTKRGDHELYCAGHLLEAAIAYDRATGKGKFLGLMKDYMALIKRLFMDEQNTVFKTPGHEEIELALVKLYDYTGERQWLDLAIWFIDNRLTPDSECGFILFDSSASQSHLPVREQTTAEGHAVRAVYLYCAMADIAKRTGDTELHAVCERLFDNIVNSKMYITGGIGSTHNGEAFEDEYRLPNDTAYAETCAALGLALFSRRMTCLDPNAKYADTAERIIYNGFLSGLSLDGKSFFYENAQEIDLHERQNLKQTRAKIKDLHMPITERVAVFECSCCPPNIARFIPSIADFIYSYSEDTVYINQYMGSTTSLDNITLTQKTAYPFDGKITLKLRGDSKKLGFRIPSWCNEWTLTKNGKEQATELIKGYAYTVGNDGDKFTLNLKIEAKIVRSDGHVITNRGLSAVTYGPFVMCLEGVDNRGWLGDVTLCGDNTNVVFDGMLGVPTLVMPAKRYKIDGLYGEPTVCEEFAAKLIPYFTFANRGETDMRIWIAVEG